MIRSPRIIIAIGARSPRRESPRRRADVTLCQELSVHPTERLKYIDSQFAKLTDAIAANPHSALGALGFALDEKPVVVHGVCRPSFFIRFRPIRRRCLPRWPVVRAQPLSCHPPPQALSCPSRPSSRGRARTMAAAACSTSARPLTRGPGSAERCSSSRRKSTSASSSTGRSTAGMRMCTTRTASRAASSVGCSTRCATAACACRARCVTGRPARGRVAHHAPLIARFSRRGGAWLAPPSLSPTSFSPSLLTRSLSHPPRSLSPARARAVGRCALRQVLELLAKPRPRRLV